MPKQIPLARAKAKKEKGEEELCLCSERQWGMLLAKMEFQFKAEFIKDDVCAYVDNIVSFKAYERIPFSLFVCLV
jgi:hypothetical protein